MKCPTCGHDSMKCPTCGHDDNPLLGRIRFKVLLSPAPDAIWCNKCKKMVKYDLYCLHYNCKECGKGLGFTLPSLQVPCPCQWEEKKIV